RTCLSDVFDILVLYSFPTRRSSDLGRFPSLSLGGDGSTARRTGPCGTAIAMVARRDLALIELNRIKVADMGGHTMVHRQIEHLVEVAVVEGTIPTHRDRVAAHDAGRCSGVEGIGQSLHILLVVAAL